MCLPCLVLRTLWLLWLVTDALFSSCLSMSTTLGMWKLGMWEHMACQCCQKKCGDLFPPTRPSLPHMEANEPHAGQHTPGQTIPQLNVEPPFSLDASLWSRIYGGPL